MKNNFASGFIACLALALLIGIPYVWPPVLSYVFNSLFWSGTFLFALCAYLVAYLYRTRGGSTRGVRFYFGLLLIISASFMYSGFDEVARNVNNWEPLLRKDYPRLFLLLGQFLGYTKNIVSLGFAAIGASVVANAIVEK